MNNFFDRILNGNYNMINTIGDTSNILKKNKKQVFYLYCKNLVVYIVTLAVLVGIFYNIYKDIPVESFSSDINAYLLDIENIDKMTESEILASLPIFQNGDFIISFIIGICVFFILTLLINFISNTVECKIFDNIVMKERRDELKKSLMYYFKRYGIYFLAIVLPYSILLIIIAFINNTFEMLIQNSDAYFILSLLNSLVNGIIQIFFTVALSIIFFEYLLIGKSLDKTFKSLFSIGIKKFSMIALYVFLLNMVIGMVGGMGFLLLIALNAFVYFIFAPPIFYGTVILCLLLFILILVYVSFYVFFGININYLNYRYKIIGRDDFIEECGLKFENTEEAIVGETLL